VNVFRESGSVHGHVNGLFVGAGIDCRRRRPFSADDTADLVRDPLFRIINNKEHRFGRHGALLAVRSLVSVRHGHSTVLPTPSPCSWPPKSTCTPATERDTPFAEPDWVLNPGQKRVASTCPAV
jgi:hypothetical protein